MKMWFLANPPGAATMEVQNVDDFKWLNASYSPVLHQLQSSAMKNFYFKADSTLAAATSNLKYRNPKYLSMLNHLRFYLPEVYPKLDKILFLDDDVVVQKDLTPLWDVDLGGNVNGAVETCGSSFHRFDKYLNFSNSLISENFDANACGWAYGMNVFDLKQWRKHNITGIYHRWQSKVCIACCSTILNELHFYSLETVNCDVTGLYICLKSDRYFARNKFVPDLR
jgi:alpha-1,4-galacturonosyltransferase